MFISLRFVNIYKKYILVCRCIGLFISLRFVNIYLIFVKYRPNILSIFMQYLPNKKTHSIYSHSSGKCTFGSCVLDPSPPPDLPRRGPPRGRQGRRGERWRRFERARIHKHRIYIYTDLSIYMYVSQRQFLPIFGA